MRVEAEEGSVHKILMTTRRQLLRPRQTYFINVELRCLNGLKNQESGERQTITVLPLWVLLPKKPPIVWSAQMRIFATFYATHWVKQFMHLFKNSRKYTPNVRRKPRGALYRLAFVDLFVLRAWLTVIRFPAMLNAWSFAK